MPDELLLNAHSAVAALELREPKKYEYHFRTVPSKQSTRSVHSSGTSILPRTISPTDAVSTPFARWILGIFTWNVQQ